MAKLIYAAITSLDGYIEDAEGKFDWSVPDEEVHAFVNDLERTMGTYLYGRRMYETMVFWETRRPRPMSRQCSGTTPNLASSRKGRVLPHASDRIQCEDTNRPRVRSRRRPRAQAVLRADIAIGGAELASQAIAAGLVDECHLFLCPIVVGGGKRALSDNIRAELDSSTNAGSETGSFTSTTASSV